MIELSGLNLNLLVALDALLQEGSVTRAGRRMGLSTPAMSHALARLRTQLQDPLLVRAGATLVLTPRASEIKPRVRTLVAEARSLLSPAQAFEPSRLERTFCIHASDHMVTVLGSALDSLVREAPQVSLRFLPNLADDATPLRDGSIDLAVAIYPKLPPEFRTQRLFHDRFICAIREGHPTIGRRLTLEQFVALEHVQVAPRHGYASIVDSALKERGLVRRVARAVPYFLAGLLLVARTNYILTISERVARLLAPHIQVRLIEPPLELPGYALSQIWHPRLDGDPAHRWLRERFVRAAQVAAPDLPLAKRRS